MPQMYMMQPEEFMIPVTAWYDGPQQSAKVELFGGVDTVLIVGDDEWDMHPRIDVMRCYAVSGDDEAAARNGVKPPLPDLTGWLYGGDVTLSGRPAHSWRLQRKLGEDQVNNYIFYTAVADGAPLKLHMFGRNLMEESHFDEYIYEFTTFEPFKSGTHGAVFQKPALCDSAEMTTGRGWLSLQAGALMPGAHAGAATIGNDADAHTAAAYAHWWVSFGRGSAAGAEQHDARLAAFRASSARVATHNADPERAYSMKLGRYADWSAEEFYGTLMPDTWRRMRGVPSRKAARRADVESHVPGAFDSLGKFKRKLKDHELPESVDWRGTLVDLGVKDQGYCGSCWSFAATGAMEAQWFLSTGDVRSFSEQQIVDCAWDYGNDGCDGGEAEAGINYVAQKGGAALEEDYFYKGADDFCTTGSYEQFGQFKGYLEVESRDEKALMEAVFRMGPVAVAVDASPDGFGFYKEGVFSDPKCSTTDLDHAVVLYGYGTTKRGTDYWIVKNSWSKLFGDDGFIKIERGERDCGIATQASIAVVAEASVVPGLDARRDQALLARA